MTKNANSHMNLNDYRDEVDSFLLAAGGRNDASKIITRLEWVQEELDILKSSIGDHPKMQHQVYDILFLLFEIAADYDFDLDEEWARGRKRKKEKYLK